MKKYAIIFLLFIVSGCYAQVPTPAKAYTPFLKLKQYRSGAINIADSLNWNYDRIDKYVDTLYNKKTSLKGFKTLRGGFQVLDTATVSLGNTPSTRPRSIWFDGDSVIVYKNLTSNDTLATRGWARALIDTIGVSTDTAEVAAYADSADKASRLFDEDDNSYTYLYWGRSLYADENGLQLRNKAGTILSSVVIPYPTLSSFSATSPLSYNNSTGVFSIPKATSSVDGYLDNDDWALFNSKVSLTILSDSLDMRASYEAGERALLESSISLNASSISSEVTNRTNADATLQSAITQNADNINLKVSKNDVINQINISTEGVDIDASKISISGTTTFASGYNPSLKVNSGGAAADINENTTTIDGGKITANTITANKLNVTSLSAINATLGTVSGGTIKGSLFTTGTDFTGTTGQVDINQRSVDLYYTVGGGSSYAANLAAESILLNKYGPSQSTYIYPGSILVNGNSVLVSGVATASDISGLNTTLSGKTTTSNLHLTGEGAPSGSPSAENMTYYDSDNGHYYVNFGTGSWVRVQIL